MNSKFGSLNLRDLLHGFFITVLSSVLTILIQLIQNGGLNLTKEDLYQLATVAIVSGLSYLSKKLFSDENGKVVGKL